MLQVVLFKRDLRVADHLPLTLAARAGPVLPLYVAEPALWAQPDASARQWAFVAESLADLRADLAALGQPLVVRVGDIPTILSRSLRRFGPFVLWSHEETGTRWTWDRDRAIAAWCRAHGIAWTELPQNGVIRRLRGRDGWARKWEAFMAQPLAHPAPLTPLPDVDPGEIPDAAALGLAPDPCPGRQPGGRRAAEAALDGFLRTRGRRYHLSLSSPLTAAEACGRVSPHLAWGTLSMREVSQAARARRAEWQGVPTEEAAAWRRALDAFIARLHWHCHFMQKLESAPGLEFDNLHPAYDGMRADPHDGPVAHARFDAWCRGATGLPFVDACMRALTATGWINFRMRAMLCAVSSYHLWLHWRQPALHLARLFTDYEPGIHFAQMQMQSGTTGINTIRIYNPVKQGCDHDPHGVFIRRWCPELASVPDAHLHEPWTLSPQDRARLAAHYPPPIVDPVASARDARAAVWGVRGGAAFRQVADAIQDRHGSRRSGLRAVGRKPSRRPPASQPDLLS